MSRGRFTKLIVATLLGSLTMFIWGSFSHALLFTGTGGIPVKELLKTNVAAKGIYFFPDNEFGSSSNKQKTVAGDNFRAGPVGILGYRPAGGNPFAAGKLITQFLGNVLSVLIAVQMASLIQAGYWKRVLAVTHIGLLTCS